MSGLAHHAAIAIAPLNVGGVVTPLSGLKTSIVTAATMTRL